MTAPIGLGLVLLVVGLGTLFIPGVGILGIIFLIVGVMLIVGGFATGRRTARAARQ